MKSEGFIINEIEMQDKTTNAAKIKTTALYLLIGFLILGGLFAIITVLTGRFSHFEIKVLLTTLVIVFASIGSLSCSTYMTRSGRAWAGVAGITLAVFSASLLILDLWWEVRDTTVWYWKTVIVTAIFAAAFAHSLALLCVRLSHKYRWIKVITTVNIFLLAAVASTMIIFEMDNAVMFRAVMMLAILAALETLAIPILSKIVKYKREGESSTKRLTLTEREEGLYEDTQGNLYRVEKMEE